MIVYNDLSKTSTKNGVNTTNWLTFQNVFSVSDLPTTGTPYYLSIRYVGHHESPDKKRETPTISIT